MKRLHFLGLAFFCFALTHVSHAQVQIGLHGSRLEGTGSSQWGGGGHVKFLLGDKLALGVGARVYPKDMKTEKSTINGTDYRVSRGNTIVPVTGSVDYYFGEAMVRPYIGADAGAFFTQYNYSVVESDGSSAQFKTSNKKTYFGAAPRAGINIEFGAVGLFGQAGYNILFGSGNEDDITVPGITADIDAKPTDKFWTFDVGLFFKLGRKKGG
jgi:outer membrane protein W